MRLRPKLLSLHRWIGLLLALLLFVQGLTGAAIVFGDELQALIHPELSVTRKGETQPVQSMLAHVRTSYPGHEITRVDFPSAPGRALLFRLKERGSDAPYLVALDPYRNVVVREGGADRWPIELLILLHQELLSGDAGETVVGIGGAGLLVLAVTGPLAWWPGRRRLKQALRVRLDKGFERGLRELHRSAGAIGAVVLLLSAATGTMMVFKDGLRSVLRTSFTVVDKPAPKVAARADMPFLPVDDLIDAARRKYGATPLRQLRFPGGHGRVVTVFLAADASNRPKATKQIAFDSYTGAELGHYVAGELPSSNEFIDWLYPVHTGHFLATPGRALMLLGGVLLALMSASGIWLWLSRSRFRRSRQGIRQAP